jgi:hypothetical protein
MLPREQTAHPDPLSDEEVRDWVERWENLRNVGRMAPRKAPVLDQTIQERLEGWLAYLNRGVIPIRHL